MNKLKFQFGIFLLSISSLICKGGTVSIILENDCFMNDDNDYTHGTAVSYMLDEGNSIFDNVGFELNQNIYTPEDINTDKILYGDRPYAGTLLFSIIGLKTFDDFDFKMIASGGVLGESSFSGKTQKAIHKIISAHKPMGWDNQINDELIMEAQLWISHTTDIPLNDYYTLSLLPYAGVQIGNLKDVLALGYDFKIGYYIPRNWIIDHGIVVKDDSLNACSSPAAIRRRRVPFQLYILAGVELDSIAWDSTLSGGWFSESIYTVDSKPCVGELHYGVSVEIYEQCKLTYWTVYRSREYEGQGHNSDYSIISLSWKF